MLSTTGHVSCGSAVYHLKGEHPKGEHPKRELLKAVPKGGCDSIWSCLVLYTIVFVLGYSSHPKEVLYSHEWLHTGSVGWSTRWHVRGGSHLNGKTFVFCEEWEPKTSKWGMQMQMQTQMQRSFITWPQSCCFWASGHGLKSSRHYCLTSQVTYKNNLTRMIPRN